MDELFFALFWVLFGSVFVWFFLIVRLFKMLEKEHPEKYEEMGKPSLFGNNSPNAAKGLMKFLFKREYSKLGNQKLHKLGNTMLVFFVLYTVLFAFMFSSIMFGLVPL